MTEDLAAWLLEQIAADRAKAEACGSFVQGEWQLWTASGCTGAWSPARVLAECDAKRRRVAWHQPAKPSIGPGDPRCKTCVVWAQWPQLEAGPLPYPCPSLRLEALSYDDRPGYQEEWRP